MEGEAQEPTLATRGDPVGDVQERPGDERTVTDDPDLATLLGDEQAAGAVVRVDDGERQIQAGDDVVEADRQAGRVEGGR